MIKSSRLATLALGVALSSVTFAQIALTPDNTVINPSYAGGIFNSYSIIASTFYAPFTGLNAQSNVVFTGELNSYVLQNNANGDLAFAWIVWNDATSTDDIVNLSVTHYAGFSTSVAQDPLDNSGYGTNTNSVFASETGDGDTVTFQFDGGLGALSPGSGSIAAGLSSSPQIIFTDAKFYTTGSAQISDGGVATLPTYCPAVPEPAPFAALGLGLLGFVRRRTKK